jgi:hypothetical protein
MSQECFFAINPLTKDDTIKVDVRQRVVILRGEMSSWLAKRAVGTPGERRTTLRSAKLAGEGSGCRDQIRRSTT